MSQSVQAPQSGALLSLQDIQLASERIAPYVQATPLLESAWLNAHLGARILFKPEVLQKTGAFKYRGAVNFLAQLSPSAREHGVVAYSSGNHAQALAAAARVFGVRSVIVMPEDAPSIKIESTRYYGADVVLYDRLTQDRVALAENIASERGATIVPPFDHPWIMAGQGTVGLSLLEETQAQGVTLQKVFIPCSGGGLTAGCATALRAFSPETEIYAVEPAGYDDTRRSFLAGERTAIQVGQPTLCDSLALAIPGELTFEVNRKLLNGVCVVSDDLVRQAVRLAFNHLKLVVEPGGAAGLAALLTGDIDIQGQNIAVVLSGGNVDPDLFQQILTAP